MIELYMGNYNRFEWLHLSRINRDILHQKRKYGYETVQEIVQKHKFGYQSKKTKLKNANDNHLTTLLNPETKGLFLCCLKTNSGMNSHVIGIDCNNQKIYDCEETHALTLTKSNISLCCGENSGGVKEVSLCFIIDERPKKKKELNKK